MSPFAGESYTQRASAIDQSRGRWPRSARLGLCACGGRGYRRRQGHIAFAYAALRARFDGVWMVNNGYDRQMASDAVASGRADPVSFGRPFIANPDLVERLSRDAPLNKLVRQETFHGGDAHGYTDYPTLEQSLAAKRVEEQAPA